MESTSVDSIFIIRTILKEMSKIQEDGRTVPTGHEFVHTFGVITGGVGAGLKKLERDSPINDQTVTGIMIRRTQPGAKSLNGNNLVNNAAFQASHLTLKQRNAEVLSKVPLEVIALTSDNGRWFPIDLPLVDMAQSYVQCINEAALLAGEEYEFVFRYVRTH